MSADPVQQRARGEEFIVWLPFRNRVEHRVEVHIHVELGFQSGKLADLVQLLARSRATITDLEPDRSLYHVGMPERYTQVMFLVRNAEHKEEVLRELSEKGFVVRELPQHFHESS
jgi:(p)ppGpp synthase/HD superfamily hydrolase